MPFALTFTLPPDKAFAIACLMSGGHLLIEDIPGVGKTLLAQSLAASIGGSFHRIQGTPDLLPGDVTGTMMPHGDGFELRFRPGPVFSNIVVFDELNRANPRTQSALLEATEEAAVTVDGTTRDLPDPFLLVATQNPLEMTGTYPLAEGALARGESGEADEGRIERPFIAGQKRITRPLDIFATSLLGEFFGLIHVDLPEIANILRARGVAEFFRPVVIHLKGLAGRFQFGRQHNIRNAFVGRHKSESRLTTPGSQTGGCGF